MRDFRDAKAMAHTTRATLAAMGLKITVGQSLELIAQAFGVADWNTMSAVIRAQASIAQTPPGKPTKISSPKRLAAELESTLTQAFAHAKGRKHGEVTVEHLLFALLDDGDASRVLKACGVTPDGLRSELTDYLGNELKSPASVGEDQPRPAIGFQRVLQRAVFHVQEADRFPVNTLNVLTAIFSEKQSCAVKLLNDQGVTRLDVVNYITHGLVKGQAGPAGSSAAT